MFMRVEESSKLLAIFSNFNAFGVCFCFGILMLLYKVYYCVSSLTHNLMLPLTTGCHLNMDTMRVGVEIYNSQQGIVVGTCLFLGRILLNNSVVEVFLEACNFVVSLNVCGHLWRLRLPSEMLHFLCFVMSIGVVFGDKARVLSVKGIAWDRIGWNILTALFFTISCMIFS